MLPSTTTHVPGLNLLVASVSPTTVGTPYSRARIARCDSTLPRLGDEPAQSRQERRKAGIERAHDEHVAGLWRHVDPDSHRAGTASAARALATLVLSGADGNNDAVVCQAERCRQGRRGLDRFAELECDGASRVERSGKLVEAEVDH